MLITKLWNSTQPYLSDQNLVMFLSNNFFRLICWRLVLMMMLLRRRSVKLLWLKTILLCRRLELLVHWLNRLCLRIILLLIIWRLKLLLFKAWSLSLMVRIHGHILAGLSLLLLHVLEAIIVNFDVYFPIRVLLGDFFYDLVAKIFISFHHDKSITKPVECSSCISFDDPKR